MGSERQASARSPEQVRCPCGALLVRLVERGIELKCRRCKRAHIVPIDQAALAAWARSREP